MESYCVFVKRLVYAFEGSKLDYAFTGALAVSFYGVPRTTTDVDVLIAVADKADFESKVALALTRAGLEVDQRKIKNALTSGYDIVSFKDVTGPYTVDVIFSTGRLDKISGKIDGVATCFQSPEGLVAAKLRMIKATLPPERSAKDKEDVKGILAFAKVNLGAIKKQAQKDKTLEIFEALTNE